MRLAILIFLCIDLFPKSREVSLDDELRNAGYKGLVQIVDYRGTTVLFRPIDNPDTIMSATTGEIEARVMEKVKFPQKPKTGYWPAIGDSVLAVVDKKNELSLFAQEENDDYRFGIHTTCLTQHSSFFLLQQDD